jgi:hypothetical protein
MLAILAHAEPATTIRAVQLKQSPASDAPTVAALAPNTAVDLSSRQGAWVQLRTASATGWAKLFDVRLASSGAARSGGEDAVATTLGLATGTRAPTVTTGVRGLDAEALQHATANLQQVQKLDGYASDKDRAQAFAKQGNLASRTVDEPKSGAGTTFRLPGAGSSSASPENPR